MALHNPEILKGAVPAKTEQAMKDLSRQFLAGSPFTKVECAILDSAELQPWITLRHTGENDGAGLVGWGMAEQGRWIERTTGKKALELQFVDRYIEHTRGDAAEAERARNVPPSTLRRFIKATPVRERLGISINESDWAYSDYPPDEMHKWLRRVVHDLSTGRKKVTDLYTNKQMVSISTHLQRTSFRTRTRA